MSCAILSKGKHQRWQAHYSANALVPWLLQLADFGLSRVLDTDRTHVSTQTYGTLAYQPAELLQEGKLTKAADEHSFSMIMYEMYTKKRLFDGCNTGQVSCAPAALVNYSPDQASAQVQCQSSPEHDPPSSTFYVCRSACLAISRLLMQF